MSEDSATTSTTAGADADFAADALSDLYRYRHKHRGVALTLAVLLGVLGAHRFYLGKVFTGVAQLFSGGGGLVWWIWDWFHVRSMVETYNIEQDERERQGLPPKDFAFLPPLDQLNLAERPSWVKRREGRGQIIGGGALLTAIGVGLGAICGSLGFPEPIVTVFALIFVTLFGARWMMMTRIPVLSTLTRWHHRLRLYYFAIDPGNVAGLALRPFAGVFFAPWRQRARAEVRLYLQLGVFFAVAFAALDLAEARERDSMWASFGLLVGEFAQTLVYTYALVAPVGAILTTQLLISRRDGVVWSLSAVTMGAILFGFWAVGVL